MVRGPFQNPTQDDHPSREYSIATHLDDPDVWDVAVRERIRGVTNLILHAPYHDLAPGSIDPEVQAVTMKRFQQACAISATHGIDRIVCHAGYTPRAYPPHQWVSRSGAFWQRYLGDKPAGFRMYIENVAEEWPELLRDLVDAVADPRLAVCLDVGHANVNSPVALPGWIDQLGPRIGHVHLHNNDGAADRHWRLDPGTVDMAETLCLLARHSPHVTFTIEAAEEEACLTWLAERGWLKRT